MDVDQLVRAVDPARGVPVEWLNVDRIIAGAPIGRPRSSPSGSWIRRSRWPAWAWLGVVVVLAFVLALGIRVLPYSKPSGGPASNPTRETTMPKELVVWTSSFHVEVISSTSGRVIRILAGDVGLYRGTPNLTVSPTGTVYFDQAETVNGLPTEQIVKVPLSGGPITEVAEGHDPVLSPNGHLLAYLTYTDLSNAPEGIAVRDLLSGTTRRWKYSSTLPDIGQLTWAPDSRSLSFTTTTPSVQKGPLILSTWVLDVESTNYSLEDARRIPLQSGVAWVGFLNGSAGIGVVQHRGLTSQGGWFEIMQVDVRTGRIVRRLADFPGSLAVDNAYDGAEQTLQLDPSRRDLAIAKVGSGHGSLYHWTIGGGPIVRIATGVVTAAWVPQSTGSP